MQVWTIQIFLWVAGATGPAVKMITLFMWVWGVEVKEFEQGPTFFRKHCQILLRLRFFYHPSF